MGFLVIIGLIVIGYFTYYKIKDKIAWDRHFEHMKWEQSEEGKRILAERKIAEENEWCKGKNTSTDLIGITGDYFQANFSGGDYHGYGYGTTYYCKYVDSLNCMYCARRRIVQKDEKYYYGSSKNCEYYSVDYSDD